MHKKLIFDYFKITIKIKEDNYITCKYLNSLGFYWPDLNYDNFKKLIKYMQSVGFIK